MEYVLVESRKMSAWSKLAASWLHVALSSLTYVNN